MEVAIYSYLKKTAIFVRERGQKPQVVAALALSQTTTKLGFSTVQLHAAGKKKKGWGGGRKTAEGAVLGSNFPNTNRALSREPTLGKRARRRLRVALSPIDSCQLVLSAVRFN